MNDQYTKTRLLRSSYFLHTLVANGWWARTSGNLTQGFKFLVTMIQSVLKISVVKIYLNYTSTRQSPLQVGQMQRHYLFFGISRNIIPCTTKVISKYIKYFL